MLTGSLLRLRRISRLIVVIGLGGGCAAAGTRAASEHSLAAPTSPAAEVPPAVAAPAIGIIPPNGSRIIATIRQRTVWPPGSLVGTPPGVRPNRTLYSLSLDVLSAAPAMPTLGSLAQPGTIIEVFSSEPLPADLVGTTVTAVVELTGTTQGTRWLILEIRRSQ
jgi:hypothetical protein